MDQVEEWIDVDVLQDKLIASSSKRMALYTWNESMVQCLDTFTQLPPQCTFRCVRFGLRASYGQIFVVVNGPQGRHCGSTLFVYSYRHDCLAPVYKKPLASEAVLSSQLRFVHSSCL